MPKNYETGHARNLANFNEIIRYVISYGKSHAPPVVSLSLSSLKDKATNVRNALDLVNRAHAVYNVTLAAKDEELKPLKKLSTRVVNLLGILGLPVSIMDEAASLIRKMRGKRASTKLSMATIEASSAKGVEVKQISVSQQSEDNLIETFDKLIHLLKTVSTYTPNETDLSIANLEDKLSRLKATHQATANEAVNLYNARANRDLEMYVKVTGMTALAMGTKKYVKAVFGATSTEYKQISGIEFDQ
nr:hypothetical protein [Pedobacter sp. ASV2]